MSFIEQHQSNIASLCERYGIKELYVFGSAVREDFSAESDVDFLVVFDYAKTSNAFHQYFDFKDALERLLGRSVDLVCYHAIRNPYFKEEVEETKRPVYAA